MNRRFSKQAVLDWTARRIEVLELRYAFKRNEGTYRYAGKGEDVTRAHGEYTVLLQMESAVRNGTWPAEKPKTVLGPL